jgi:hypothetical protein
VCVHIPSHKDAFSQKDNVMAITTKTTVATRAYQFYPGNGASGSRNDFVLDYKAFTDKTSGSFVSLGGGNRFRKATAISRVNVQIQPTGPLIFQGQSNNPLAYGQDCFIKESSGGAFGDGFVTSSYASALIKGNCIEDGRTYPVIPTLMRNEAVTKALLKIADQKAGLGEDLATMRQTVRLIKNPLQALVNGLKSVRDNRSLRPWLRYHARMIREQGIVDVTAQKYLEYVYGWKPLVQDIYGIIELAKQQGLKPLLLHAEGSSKSSSGIPDCQFNDISGGNLSKFTNGKETSRVNCSLWAQLDPNYAGLRALNQLGLLNPLSLAWELVSWSFVVDWVVPIGPVLSALSAPAGLSFVDGTLSAKAQGNASLSIRAPFFDDRVIPGTIKEVPASAKWSYTGYKREVLTNWPMPGFYYNSDPFGLDGDLNDRPLKALALAITNLRNF